MQLTSADGITLMAIDTKPNRTAAQHVEERFALGVCLHCDDPIFKLGCCVKHYGQYRNELQKQPLAERAIFTAKQIRKGRIAKSRQGQRRGLKNPFAE